MALDRRLLLAAAIVAGALAAARGASGADAARWIVFSGLPNGLAPAQLFRVQTDGAGLEQVTTGSNPATDPAFSPDGKQLVFSRLGSGIFRVNLDGTGLHRLTSGRRDSYPVWSPDGKHIAFIRPFREQWRLYVMAASGAGQRRLPEAPVAGRPTWTAKGASIIIPAGGDLARVDARTGRVEKFFGAALDPVIAQAATLSPDARTVAFVGSRPSTGSHDCGEALCEGRGPFVGRYVSSVSARKPVRIADDTGPAGWSPDGKTLVYVSKGALTLDTIGTDKRTAIATGANVVAGDAPPAWQPR
jgi:Tol biopolymer transport system component